MSGGTWDRIDIGPALENIVYESDMTSEFIASVIMFAIPADHHPSLNRAIMHAAETIAKEGGEPGPVLRSDIAGIRRTLWVQPSGERYIVRGSIGTAGWKVTDDKLRLVRCPHSVIPTILPGRLLGEFADIAELAGQQITSVGPIERLDRNGNPVASTEGVEIGFAAKPSIPGIPIVQI